MGFRAGLDALNLQTQYKYTCLPTTHQPIQQTTIILPSTGMSVRPSSRLTPLFTERKTQHITCCNLQQTSLRQTAYENILL